MLKGLTKNLEEELMKEKTRHQRSTSKRSQEYRDLLEEVSTIHMYLGSVTLLFTESNTMNTKLPILYRIKEDRS